LDLVFTNATAQRRSFLAFSDDLLVVEKGVLVAGEAPIQDLASLHMEPRRIGYSKGSTTSTEFGSLFPRAQMVATDSLEQAAMFLNGGGLEGFATNHAILARLQREVPGSRVLPGAWGSERYALGMPIARAQAPEAFPVFVGRILQPGVLRGFVDRSGFQGANLP
jgi:polar amino acid transport system substrate-binding protein